MVQTPMETGGTWATLSEEVAFLAALAAEFPTVTVESVLIASEIITGMLPMRVVTVGDADSARAVVVASQHANEPAGREAALRFVRDAATSGTPVVVIPNANPYGLWYGGTRGNPYDDINRTHLNLSTSEARIIAAVLAKVPPGALIIDAHESASTDSSGAPVTGQANYRATSPAASPAHAAWSAQVPAWVAAAVPGATVALYPDTAHEGTLQNALAAAGRPAVIVETLITEAPASRVAWHLAVMHAAAAQPSATAIVEATREWNRAEGFLAHAPLPLAGGAHLTPPVGYLTPASVGWVLAAHGIASVIPRDGSTRLYVPLDQPGRMLAVWLLDPRGPRPITPNAVPVFADDEVAVDLTTTDYHLPSEVRVAGVRPRRLVVDGQIVWGT